MVPTRGATDSGYRKRCALVVAENDPGVVLSARGAERVSVIYADGLNATSAITARNIVATLSAVERIDSLWNDAKAPSEVV